MPCANGPHSPPLQRAHLGLGAQGRKEGVGAPDGAAEHEIGEVLDDEARAVLGARRRPVGEDLAPAMGAVPVLQPEEDGRPVAHHAEGGRDRHLDRLTEDMRLDAGDGDRLSHHGFGIAHHSASVPSACRQFGSGSVQSVWAAAMAAPSSSMPRPGPSNRRMCPSRAVRGAGSAR